MRPTSVGGQASSPGTHSRCLPLFGGLALAHEAIRAPHNCPAPPLLFCSKPKLQPHPACSSGLETIRFLGKAGDLQARKSNGQVRLALIKSKRICVGNRRGSKIRNSGERLGIGTWDLLSFLLACLSVKFCGMERTLRRTGLE